MKKLLLAFQFLTIIPFVRMDGVSEKDVGGSSAYYPVVGAVHGGLLVLSGILLLKIFPVELTAAVVLLFSVLMNGGLHLDGLADTFDAIASRGDRQRKLAVMKDSAVGPFGVVAIVFALLLKYAALVAIYNNALPGFLLSLYLMPLLSRWAMVPGLFHGRSARQDGLGRTFIEHTGIKELVAASVMMAMFAALPFFMLDPFYGHTTTIRSYAVLAATPVPVLYVFGMISVWFSNKHFGGMTGDTFGTVSELSEILLLLTVVICSHIFI